MPEFQLTTPVAFIIFNRLDTTRRVFAEIAKARPSKLLVIADGPRTNRLGEAEKCAQTRAVIDGVDWDCEVLTNFSEVNLGCKRRVSSGIDWVFDQVEEAIILEDDCVPAQSFFRFCQELLERYRHDRRVGMISGDNFQFGSRFNGDSYYFSKYVHIWGWASWRDRWAGSYDAAMAKWPRIRDEERLVDMLGDRREAAHWHRVFEDVHNGKIDTWDYQWLFACWMEGWVNVMPSVNLISNIGWGPDATHTFGGGDLGNMPVEDISFPLVHPQGVYRNTRADKSNETNCIRIPLTKLVRNKLTRMLR